MNKGFEDTYHKLEEKHWWFVARRSVVKDLVAKYATNRDASILEIGCSGGPLMKELRACGFTDLTGIDISEDAIELCKKAQAGEAYVMDAQSPSFDAESFDLIIASDVLEHLEKAEVAVSAWHRLLKTNGTLIVFVPAFMFLWSEHDIVNRHFHRYRARELAKLLGDAEFEIRRTGYWNSMLFLPVAVLRLIRRCMPASSKGLPDGDLKPVPNFLNRFLTMLLEVENSLIRAGFKLPCGVSVMVIATKPDAHESS